MQSTVPLGRPALALWLLVLPLLLYLLMTGAGAWGVYATDFRVASLVILVALFAGWAVVCWVAPGARPATTLAVPIVAILVALSAATLASDRARLGVEYVAYAAIMAGLYLLLSRLLGTPGLARRLVMVLALVTMFIAGAYIVSVVALWIEWWGLVGRITTPPTRPDYAALVFGSPGILSAFLTCAGATSVAMLWRSDRTGRALSIIVSVLVGVGILLASARSAYAAVVIAIAVTVVVGILSGGRVALPATRKSRVALLAVAGAALALALAVAPAVLRRLSVGGGEDLRATLAATAIRLFQQHPLTGAGPGTWVTYREGLTAAGEIDYYIPHAHNAPLQMLAETGLVGAAAAVLVAFLVTRLVLRALRGGDAPARAQALGVVFIATYLIVHQLFDFFLDMPMILFAAVIPLAALDATAVAARRGGRLVRRRVVAIPAALAGVALALLVTVERPALIAEAAAAELSADPAGARSAIAEALTADPSLSPYVWIEGLAASRTGDDVAAAAAFRRTAEVDDLPQAWLNLALLDLRRGEREQATTDLDGALRLGIQQPAVAVAAIPLLLELGLSDRANDAAVAALASVPSLTDDPWWDSTPELVMIRAAAVTKLLASADPSLAWQVAMFAGDEQQARAEAALLPDGARAEAELIIDAWEGVPGARAQVEANAVAAPLAGAAWAAEIASRDGDTAAAERFNRWTAIGYGTTGGGSGHDVVVTTDPTPGVEVPGPNAAFHFRYAYRRSVPWDLLIDGLPKLTLR
jgi:O-antigen ligase